MNIKFVFDIIDSYIEGLTTEYNDPMPSPDLASKIEVLEQLKTTLKDFIKNIPT